jgi:hypothetical protein
MLFAQLKMAALIFIHDLVNQMENNKYPKVILCSRKIDYVSTIV